MKATPTLRDRLEYAGLTALTTAFRVAPPGISRSLGRGAGAVAGRVVRLRRKVALENLAHAFPERGDAERVAICNRMYALVGILAADFARAAFGDRETVAEGVELEDDAPVREVLAVGRGGLLLTAHYGNWEGLGGALAARGFPITALGARQRNPLVERLLSRYRERIGMGALTVRGGLRPLVRELGEGRLVASLADQDGGPDGIFLPFLGRVASVQAGLFRLAARLGTPIVIGFSWWEEGRWKGRLDPPVFPGGRPGGPPAVEAEARRLAAHYTARVEEEVRRRPDHWFWVHRRWRTRPPEEREEVQHPRAGRR